MLANVVASGAGLERQADLDVRPWPRKAVQVQGSLCAKAWRWARPGSGRVRRWACPEVGVSGGGLEQGCPVPFGGRISTEVEDPAGKVGWF